MSTFGERVRDKRLEHRWSQAELASKSGLSQVTICNIERGRNSRSSSIALLAHVLGVEALWLAEGRGPKESAPAYSATSGQVVTIRAESPSGSGTQYAAEDPAIAEVARMMRETDAIGRQLALGAVRGALANHQAPIKNHCVQ